ncbi:MAG: hypothetical protein N2651_07515 [Fimbriimonadales bacterium]|nr:hypothetical protein [Fimbriimonadales bacterium]
MLITGAQTSLLRVWMRRAARVTAVAGIVLASLGFASTQSITWLGQLSPNGETTAYAVSADGQVVVGESGGSAFVWTLATGMQPLPSGGGALAAAYDIDPSGTVIVGYSAINGPKAVRWSGAGWSLMQIYPSGVGYAYAISQNLQIVGVIADPNTTHSWPYGDAYHTHQGFLPPTSAFFSAAYDVSANGAVAVGEMWLTHTVPPQAARWSNGGWEVLGALDGRDSRALAVSADGNIVVGWSKYGGNLNAWHAFRWEGGALTDLGALPGTSISEAHDISADGSVIVGFSWAGSPNPTRATRWTQNGIEDLNQTYASLLGSSGYLFNARGISPDGRYIVGAGRHNGRIEAYLLDTRPACTSHNGDVDNNGCVDDADLLAVLFAFGQTGQSLGRVDVNCDQTVDDADLLIVLFNFGDGC